MPGATLDIVDNLNRPVSCNIRLEPRLRPAMVLGDKALRIPTAGGVIFRKSVKHPGLDARVFVTIQDEDISEMVTVAKEYVVGN